MLAEAANNNDATVDRGGAMRIFIFKSEARPDLRSAALTAASNLGVAGSLESRSTSARSCSTSVVFRCRSTVVR